MYIKTARISDDLFPDSTFKHHDGAAVNYFYINKSY